MFNGYFNKKSECLAGFTGKKLRQRPMDTGVTTLGICLRNETVDRSLRRFLQAIDYRGIVDVGCRYDARDGKYKLLDVNPRIGCTFRLFVDPFGMDVVRACYLDLTGQPVHAAPACEGRKWVVENRDVAELPAHFKARKLTVREWLRSLRGVRETAWFDWPDPIPFFAMVAESAWAFVRERIFQSRFRRLPTKTSVSPRPTAPENS
jgi:D-aspartate ligase